MAIYNALADRPHERNFRRHVEMGVKSGLKEADNAACPDRRADPANHFCRLDLMNEDAPPDHSVERPERLDMLVRADRELGLIQSRLAGAALRQLDCAVPRRRQRLSPRGR